MKANKNPLLMAMLSMTLTTFLFSFRGMAQGPSKDAVHAMTDSIRMHYLTEAAVKYPLLRQVVISTDVMGNASVHSRLYGKDLFEGRVQIIRLKAGFNMPVYQWGKNTITSSFKYARDQYDLKDVVSNSQLPVTDMHSSLSAMSFGLGFTRSDSLFHLPVILSGAVAMVTDPGFSNRRVNGLGVISFSLKRTATTSMSVGAAVLIDPSSPVPAFIIFNYWHRFGVSGPELFLDMPYRAVLRKQLSPKAALAAGVEFGGNLSLFNVDQPALPQHVVYASNEIRESISFEYRIAPKVMLGLQGGYVSTLSSKLFDVHAGPGDYFIKNAVGGAPFVNLTFSLLPFWKGFHGRSGF